MSCKSVFVKFAAVFITAITVMQTVVFANENEAPFFVNDAAEVISESLEQQINEVGEVILAQSGCRLAVASVDFLGGSDIEQFCRELYIENSMGDNGVLLLFSVAEENYHIVRGEALKNKLTDAKLNEIMEQYIEPPFEAKDYETAINDAHREITEKLEEIYSVTSDKEQYLQQLHEIELANQKTLKTKKIYGVLLIISVIIAFLFLIRMTVSMYYHLKRKGR